MQRFSILAVGVLSCLPLFLRGEEAANPDFTRKEDVLYGRKYGSALTLDVLTPSKPNGLGILWMVSGGWFSDHSAIRPEFIKEILKRGYTVFAVVHGSQPKYTIPEVLEDIHRAVRFVRYHAKDYGIDPNRLGITGASAGGHLSLMQGTAGKDGKPDAKDPVDKESSRVQAVACFFPPTDFLNYGKPGEDAIGRGILKDFHAPFDFHEFDPKTKSLIPIAKEERIVELGKSISPVTHVTPDDAPTLIIHGDADKLVPIQQAEVMVEALKKAGIPAKLVTKPGAAHGWANMAEDMVLIADWFDEHLKSKVNEAQKAKAE
jgi:acetyl esterase/lipase